MTAFAFNDGNEEIYRSKTLISGPVPKVVRIPLPKSTDFAVGSTTTPVIRFSHSASSNLRWSMNLIVEYKGQTPLSFF
jgi:hypothetical protein